MKQVFLFAHTGGSSLPIVVAIVVFMGLLVSYFAYAPSHIHFELTPEKLSIRGDLFYGREIPRSDLVLDQARELDLDRDRDFRLVARTNGTGLPGYKAGWFRLANGQKALAFIGDPHRVVLVPVRSGYTLLLSTVDPGKLIASLKAS